MLRLFTLLLITVAISAAQAQTTEHSVQLSSGFFRYGGLSATRTSPVYISDYSPEFHINNPFGKRSGLSYGLSLQTQRVTAKKFILGVGLGYDRLTAITNIEPYLRTGNYIGGVTTKGKVRLHTHTIRANPYFGYRIPIKKVNLDLNAGFHLSYILKSSQTVTYDDQPKGVDKKSHFTKINTKFDVGPSAGLTVSYNRLSINANYTHGLLNYRHKLDGANLEIYSRYVRLGIGYRINN